MIGSHQLDERTIQTVNAAGWRPRLTRQDRWLGFNPSETGGSARSAFHGWSRGGTRPRAGDGGDLRSENWTTALAGNHEQSHRPDPDCGARGPRQIKRIVRACEIAPGVHFLAGFGNTTILVGTKGVAVVDPGLFTNGPRVVNELRSLTDLPVRYVIYTHGHYDHAFGTPAVLDDAAQRGHEPPDIVGHVNVAKRFERYAKTSGHLAATFDSQFAMWGPDGGDVVRKAKYFPPTITYEDRLPLEDLGDLPLECRHGLGETDDHTWVWLPGPRVIVGGDFIVSSLPNAGTPFRVQRYVLEWAEALEEMAALEPAAIISGHGGVFREHGD